MDKKMEEALIQAALMHFKVFQEFMKLTENRSDYRCNWQVAGPQESHRQGMKTEKRKS